MMERILEDELSEGLGKAFVFFFFFFFYLKMLPRSVFVRSKTGRTERVNSDSGASKPSLAKAKSDGPHHSDGNRDAAGPINAKRTGKAAPTIRRTTSPFPLAGVAMIATVPFVLVVKTMCPARSVPSSSPWRNQNRGEFLLWLDRPGSPFPLFMPRCSSSMTGIQMVAFRIGRPWRPKSTDGAFWPDDR